MFLSPWLRSLKRRSPSQSRRRSLARLSRNNRLLAIAQIEKLEDRTLLAATPTISINDVTQVEGDSGTSQFVLTVTRTGKLTNPSSVTYYTSSSATPGEDFEPVNGIVSLASGEKTKTIAVTVYGDQTPEGDESFYINLTSPFVNAKSNGNWQGEGKIVNDDTAFSIDDVQPLEGTGGTTAFVLTVVRDGDTTGASSVEFATVDGAGPDYDIVNTATLNFAAGETAKTITVNVIGDTVIETDETFTVLLSIPFNGNTIADAIGQGTILDDDSAPTISISDLTLTEGVTSSEFIDTFIPAASGGLNGPIGMLFGPDGNLYVASYNSDQVMRYDGTTGIHQRTCRCR